MENLTFYISIITSSALVLSELLPFLPVHANGILHFLFIYLGIIKVEKPTSTQVQDVNNYDYQQLDESTNDNRNVIENATTIVNNSEFANEEQVLLLKTISEKIDLVLYKLIFLKLSSS